MYSCDLLIRMELLRTFKAGSLLPETRLSGIMTEFSLSCTSPDSGKSGRGATNLGSVA